MSDIERRLRRIVRVVALLGIAGALFGLLPGERVYDDANNCFGHAIGSFFGYGERCQSSYTKLVTTRLAGGLPLVLFVGATLLYGWILVNNPRRWVALAWLVWTAVGLVIVFAATFELDLFMHTVTLWPMHVTFTLIGAMLVLIFPIAPIVAFTSKREVIDETASARVVTR